MAPDPVDASPSGPSVPLDLEHTIFRIAALSRPSRIPNLMLVAHRVKVWVEPLMYRVVLLHDDNDEGLMLDGLPRLTYNTFLCLLTTKPPEFFASSVKHLFLGNASPSPHSLSDHMRSILDTCTGVLSLNDTLRLSSAHRGLLHPLQHLRRVVMDLQFFPLHRAPGFPPLEFSQPWFAHITHLEVTHCSPGIPGSRNLACLRRIPHLTHFAFHDREMCDTVAPLLGGCLQLECVVLMITRSLHNGDVELGGLGEDKRFFVMESTENVVKFWRLWQRGAMGWDGYWELAEAFIAARRAGQVHGELTCNLISTS
ncbi:hypothetical protein FB45DRAFT_939193, partial [Roridomyces roridus]